MTFYFLSIFTPSVPEGDVDLSEEVRACNVGCSPVASVETKKMDSIW